MIALEGIKVDPEKVSAITNMSPSTDVSKVTRFFEMVNQLSKFLPDFADITNVLRKLLSKKCCYIGYCLTKCFLKKLKYTFLWYRN